MARPKIPRKSTTIDMTAMCDVAFLLLSFFILTTKFKPSEAVSVNTPGSVASKPAPEKDVVLVSITGNGKVFLSMDNEEKKADVINALNTTHSLGLSPEQMKQLAKQEFYGVALGQLAQQITLPKNMLNDQKLPGIPCKDTINNEMNDWIAAIVTAYTGSKMNLVLKGDNASKYPAFKNVTAAFKKNDQLKIQMVTNPEGVPQGSELYIKNVSTRASEREDVE